MLVEADKVFVTASPLSELVWSPSKGLDLIRMDTSPAENKNPLWWSTESFNIILSAPECGIVGDDCHNGAMAEGPMGSLRLLPNSSSKNNMDIASPEKMVSDIIRNNKLMSASSDALEGLQQTIDNNQRQGKHFEDNEARTSSHGNCQTNVCLIDSSTEDFDKALNLCNDDNQRASSSSQEGVTVNTQNIKDNTRVTRSGVLPKESDFGNKNDQNSQHKELNSDTFFKVCVASEEFMPAQKHDDSRHAGKNLFYKEDSTVKELPPPLTYLHPLEMRCSVGVENTTEDFIGIPLNQKPSFFNSLGANRGRVPEVVASLPPKKSIDDAQESPGKNQNTDPEFSSGGFKKDLNKRKGKEAIHEEIMGDSIENEEGHESVESCNRKNFSTAKRARCIELEGKSSGRKRTKRVACGSSLRLPFGRSSSFMNWVSGIAKGLPCSFQTGRAPTLVPEPSDKKPGHSYSLAHLGKKGSNDSKTMGFQSFVEALYHPGLKFPQSLTETQLYHQESNDSNKELQMTNQPCGLIFSDTAHNEEGLKLHQPAPLSILSADKCHPEEGLTAISNSISNELPALGKAQAITTARHVACNRVPSSSFIRNGSNTTGDKGDTDIRKKSSEVLTKNGGSEFLSSFWVTRLCPKVVPLTYSVQCNNSLNNAVEGDVGSHEADVPHDQNKERIDVENDYKKNTTDNQEHTSNPSDSCSLKGMANDQKLNSRLRPILPSQRLKNLEPMASAFAKRLDTFRHIKTSGPVDNALFARVTCFFCGQMGHGLKECSEIKGSELEDLHKSINLYEGTQKSSISCLCIRCFEMGHWAIACPLLFKKTNHTTFVNGKEIEKQPLNSTSTIDPARHEIHGKEGSSFNFLQNERTDMDTKAFSLVRGGALSPGERKLSGKQIAFHSRKKESEGYQIIPVNNFMRREKFDKHIQVFEGIKGLRLSRIELVRGMKSRSNLEGYFLRVRLGKHEGGTGRSGYRVACICGELEKSHERPRSHVSVDIVGLKCSIDFRFVSNNDFIEDELNDWWSATLKSGKKLPTEEEITKKLQQRRKANF